MPIELNLRKQKWLLIPYYRPPSIEKDLFLTQLGNVIDYYQTKYENVLPLGDMNMTENDHKMKIFLQKYNLYSCIKKPTCFKSVTNPSCIDLILTNKKYSLQHSHSFETGLSDFHHMIYTQLKTTFVKQPPKVLKYRDYTKFSENDFLNDVLKCLDSSQSGDYSAFEIAIEKTLDVHAPIKSKYIRANEKPYMHKSLRKAIMMRSRLKNKANITKNVADMDKFKKQRNYCAKLSHVAKVAYYNNLDPKSIITSRKFWKTFKPLLSKNDNATDNKVILVQDDTIISDEQLVAETFNEYFNNVTTKLNLTEWPATSETLKINNPVVKAIQRYSDHPSIIKIKESTIQDDKFTFSHILPETVQMAINKLKLSKSARGNIPLKIIKTISKVGLNNLTDCINAAIYDCKFPNELKLADITPVLKKGDSTVVSNYRPISVLSGIAKIYERILSDQLADYINKKLSIHLCGFRKGYSTQYALLRLIEDWRQCIDKRGIVGTVLMDLSKAYDCLPHDLLLAKLDAYGIGCDALTLINDYLTNRKQRVKIGSTYSKWSDIKRGVPQGSVLGPLLFNVFANDLLLFLDECNVCNFADDNTLYVCDTDIDKVVLKLEDSVSSAIKWFEINSMVANPEKFQFMLLGLDDKVNNKLCLDMNGKTVRASNQVLLLGVTIDDKLTFIRHIEDLCKRANQKINAIQRIVHKIDEEKAKLLYNAYFQSNFEYCPLIWAFCYKRSNNLIKQTQKRALQILNKNKKLSYNELLLKYSFVSIHVRNLQLMMTEIYKIKSKLNPPFMWSLIAEKEIDHQLRTSNLMSIPSKKCTNKKFGYRSFTFRGSVLWNYLPDKIKNVPSLASFKTQIKMWKADKCNCNLCQNDDSR